MSDLRSLPSIDSLLKKDAIRDLITQFGKPLTLTCLRRTLQAERAKVKLDNAMYSDIELIKATLHEIELLTTSSLKPVINASGVILHTNLGRASLSDDAMRAIQKIGENYSTLEYDLVSGERGHRSVYVEKILKELLGVEDAFVVNNNAGAVLLVLSSLAARKRVIVSRTQLVEIGGGFRIPEVLKQSGSKIEEIGTTNQVHLTDYAIALAQPTEIVLHAHHSNYKIIGFASEPDLRDIIVQAHSHNALVVDDIGSGALIDSTQFGLAHEPTVQESLAAGADIVCFSGDKLLGGPQAGIIVGRKDLLQRIKKHPLARALRADKLLIAGLSATLLHYLKDEAPSKIPVWQMISKSSAEMKKKVVSWIKVLGTGDVVAAESTVGGGSLPCEVLPSYALALKTKKPKAFMQKLRDLDTPIIARIQDGLVLLDPRTVSDIQESALLNGLKSLLTKEDSNEE